MRDYWFPILAVLLIGVSIAVIASIMEARTYNKLTDSNVTWFDALWVQLRVDCD